MPKMLVTYGMVKVEIIVLVKWSYKRPQLY